MRNNISEVYTSICTKIGRRSHSVRGGFFKLQIHPHPFLYQGRATWFVPPWKDWKSCKSPLIKGDLEGFGDAEGRGICCVFHLSFRDVFYIRYCIFIVNFYILCSFTIKIWDERQKIYIELLSSCMISQKMKKRYLNMCNVYIKSSNRSKDMKK